MGFASAQAQVRLTSTKPRNGDPPPAPEYVDRVIEGIAPPDPLESEDEREYVRAGWPRFLRLETRLGTQPIDGGGRSVGFTVAGAIDTPNHGTLSIDANFAPDESRTAFTLRQRGLPVDGGWRVNNEIGVATSLTPGLMRMPSRVFVPSQYTRGATTEWVNEALRTQVMASAGTPGLLEGYPVAGFRSRPGSLASIAAQTGAASWDAAIRHEAAYGISSASNSSGEVDGGSTHVALRGEAGAHTIQANAVSTRTSEPADSRHGVWVEGEWKRGPALYGWGFFRLDPQLSWSGEGMTNDTEGGFVRGAWRTRQWSAEANVDSLRSISRPDDSGVYVSANGRYRWSRSLTLGGGGSFRDFGGQAGSAYVDVRQQNDWGFSGVRLDGTSNRGMRTRRLGLDHAWALPQGWSLNTTLTTGRESGEDATGSLWGAAASFSVPVGNDIKLMGNASTERRGNGTRSTGANLNVLWRVDRNWSVEANFLHSQGRQLSLPTIDPLAPPPEQGLFPTDSHSYFLVLRYEESAGSRSVPLGGRPGAGGGSIEGVVYLDGNRSDTQEAGELGASGVTVYLDGRYATRTDSQGRFEFPFVAPGPHAIRVLNETLPLPWDAGERQESRVEVLIREAARIAIPVVKRND